MCATNLLPGISLEEDRWPEFGAGAGDDTTREDAGAPWSSSALAVELLRALAKSDHRLELAPGSIDLRVRSRVSPSRHSCPNGVSSMSQSDGPLEDLGSCHAVQSPANSTSYGSIQGRQASRRRRRAELQTLTFEIDPDRRLISRAGSARQNHVEALFTSFRKIGAHTRMGQALRVRKLLGAGVRTRRAPRSGNARLPVSEV